MFIRFGFEVALESPMKLPLIPALSPHSSFSGDIIGVDRIRTEPDVQIEEFRDPFGNRRARLEAPVGGCACGRTTSSNTTGRRMSSTGTHASTR